MTDGRQPDSTNSSAIWAAGRARSVPKPLWYGSVLHGIAAHGLVLLAPLEAAVGLGLFFTGVSAILFGAILCLGAASTWLTGWFPAWRIDVEDRTMHWRRPYGRHGSAPVDDIVTIRPGGLLGQVQRIELRDGRTIRLIPHQGIDDLADSLAFAARRDIPISIGFRGRMNQFGSVQSWFHPLE